MAPSIWGTELLVRYGSTIAREHLPKLESLLRDPHGDVRRAATESLAILDP